MKDGSVLSAGSDQMKQLGRKESPGFGKVNIRAEVKDIQAWNMTACIDSNKQVYIWGTLKGKEQQYEIQEPYLVPGIQAQKVEVGRGILTAIEFNTSLLHSINCDDESFQNLMDSQINKLELKTIDAL